MNRRLAVFAVVLSAFDIAWGAAVAVLVNRGIVHAWLGLAVPISIAAGLFAWRDAAAFRRRARNGEKATGTVPTALARPHAPSSLPAPARDPLHRSIDLLARADR